MTRLIILHFRQKNKLVSLPGFSRCNTGCIEYALGTEITRLCVRIAAFRRGGWQARSRNCLSPVSYDKQSALAARRGHCHGLNEVLSRDVTQ